MKENTFKKVGASNKRMYGERKILICGVPPAEHATLLTFFKQYGFGDFPTVFISRQDEEKKLGEIISRPHLDGYRSNTGGTRTIILSGFTENELRRVLEAYRDARIPKPLMATLTPTSETWTVRKLIGELAREAEAMKRIKRERSTTLRTPHKKKDNS